MDADPATLTEPERRIALLDWLARGRDVRIAAELCGEKRDWAKDIAKAAGHPDRDLIRQALAAAKAELHPPRQLLKPDSLAPVRPRIPAPTAEEVEAFAAIAREKAPTLDDAVDAIAEALSAAPPFATRPMTRALAEHVAVTVCGPDDVDEAELPDPDPAEGPLCPDCGTEDCQVVPYCTPGDVDADDGLNPPFPHGPEHVIAAGAGDEAPARVVYEPTERPSIVAEANANDWPPPGHVHAPHLVLEGRVWHAVCDACGTTWHRTRCTAPGCGAYVSAEYIARTGSTRHDWHPKEQS